MLTNRLLNGKITFVVYQLTAAASLLRQPSCAYTSFYYTEVKILAYI